MLIDDVVITVKAGSGGDGANTFAHQRGTIKTPPDGGNGGRGGSIFFSGSSQISDLSEFSYKKKIEAPNGVTGGRNNMYGKNGKDIEIRLPLGTQVIDNTTHEELFEIIDTSKVCVARGGEGGVGNKESANPGFNGGEFSYIGHTGQERVLHLVMRLIADVGLVGLPNAGKSTLLSQITKAHPKIGDYPFTTLEPNLGVMEGLVIADIPGLIEGASDGKGLGVSFLKHIEKTRMLLHLIDIGNLNLIESYHKIRNEFHGYDPALLEKKEIIVLTKADTVSEQDLIERIQLMQELNSHVVVISMQDPVSIGALKKLIKEEVDHA